MGKVRRLTVHPAGKSRRVCLGARSQMSSPLRVRGFLRRFQRVHEILPEKTSTTPGGPYRSQYALFVPPDNRFYVNPEKFRDLCGGQERGLRRVHR